MVDLRCPHGPIIGGSVCVECATRREKDPRVAALEEQLDAFARKLVGAKSRPSCAAKDARIKELESELAASSSLERAIREVGAGFVAAMGLHTKWVIPDKYDNDTSIQHALDEFVVIAARIREGK